MILLCTLFGLIVAGAIARIEKSNKLFWILFTSFMVGIAGGSLYNKCTSAKGKKDVTVVIPTSGKASSNFTVTVEQALAPDSIVVKPMSKEHYGVITDSIALSKVCSEMSTPPPESKAKKVW